MFKISYTGMVMIFCFLQAVTFGVLVWLIRRELKRVLEAIANAKEQAMIDIRSVATIVKSK